MRNTTRNCEAPAPFRCTKDSLLIGFGVYCTTAAIVFLGLMVAVDFLEPRKVRPKHNDIGPLEVSANWDGFWYRQIAERGYSYRKQGQSSVAFFPALPLVGRAIALPSGLAISASLVLAAQLCFVAAAVLFAGYTCGRFPAESPRLAALSVMALGFWPAGVFFRMGYTESMFLLLLLFAMYGIAARWRPWVIAVVVGLATATRPVGVALLLPLAWYLWKRAGRLECADLSAMPSQRRDARSGLPLYLSTPGLKESGDGPPHSTDSSPPAPLSNERGDSGYGTCARFLCSAAVFLPMACWGLLAYMAYLWVHFGDPIAFATNMPHWVSRPSAPLRERLWALVTLEPIWGAYVPSNFAYWRNHDITDNPVFSLRFADPIYFSLTAILVLIGWRKAWLTSEEVLLSLGLLGIPYVLQSYPAVMQSHGRYAAVVYPAYIVMGKLLSNSPRPLVAAFYGACAFYLCAYAALFAAWYKIV